VRVCHAKSVGFDGDSDPERCRELEKEDKIHVKGQWEKRESKRDKPRKEGGQMLGEKKLEKRTEGLRCRGKGGQKRASSGNTSGGYVATRHRLR